MVAALPDVSVEIIYVQRGTSMLLLPVSVANFTWMSSSCAAKACVNQVVVDTCGTGTITYENADSDSGNERCIASKVLKTMINI